MSYMNRKTVFGVKISVSGEFSAGREDVCTKGMNSIYGREL